MSDRIRDWLTGRHEFVVLVEVDRERAVEFGGRPVRGGTYAEFAHVAYGSRTSARLQTVDAVGAFLAAELPEARMLAIRDVDRPRQRSPALRLAEGPRPCLLLVGASTAKEAEALVDRVCRVWELPPGRYTAPQVPDRADRPPLLLLVIGVALALPLLGLYFSGGPAAVDTLGSSRLFRVAPPLGVGTLAAAAVLSATAWFATRGRWSPRRRAGATAFLAVPSVTVIAAAVFIDALGAAARRFPAVAVTVVVAVLVVAVPVGISRVGRSRLVAVLAWALPVVAGGVAPFAGELALDRYLGWFGLERSDVQISTWAQWLLGAVVLAIFLIGADVGLALLVLGRRFLGPSAAGGLVAALVTLVYTAGAILVVISGVDDRARLGTDGVPSSLPGMRPTAVCVDPVDEPYSYIGRAAPPPGAAAVYFGRSDGRLAVWTPRTGGVLIDGQGVALRALPDHTACR